MKLIIKIAKNELRNLFYSPVAWFLIIVFLVMCAFFYTGIMYPASKSFELLYKNNPDWDILVSASFTRTYFPVFFTNILPNLYLFAPLLTMGVISRETNNGTIKLLYSSPVTLRKIVLGKYLALMIYNLLFVFVLGLFILSGFFDLRALDYGPLLSATLGFYLLLCAFTAIGFFMSSLTIYPIVAAVASFTLLFILMSIGSLWQQYNFVRDITYFLSLQNRTEWMIKGLIRTKDVIYYIIIACIFVGFTLIKLRTGREARPWYIKAGRYLLVIVSGLLIGYTSSLPRFSGYWDTTARKINTIHQRTQNIVKELGDSTLEVTLYTNLLGNDIALGLPSGRNTYLDMWEQYVRFKPDIKFKYEYYYDAMPGDSVYYKQFPGKTLQQIAGLRARMFKVDSALFKSPEEMHKLIDLKPQGYPGTIMQLNYKGRKEFLRFFPGPFDEMDDALNQYAFNASFKRLLGTKMPKLVFVNGELERSIYKGGERGYSNVGSLSMAGFDMDTVNLMTQEIPSDATTLVLADPKMELHPLVLNKLKNYISNGGNMLVLGEPGKQYVLNPVLQQIGIQLMNGQLVQPSVNETPDKVWQYHTPAMFNSAAHFRLRTDKRIWDHQVASLADLSNMAMLRGTTVPDYIADSGFIIKPLFTTKPLFKANPNDTWIKAGKLIIDSTAPVFNPQEGDIKKDSFFTAIQLARQIKGKEQRIIITGDADLASNINTGQYYFEVFCSWLNYNRFPIYTPIPPPKDNKMLLKPGWATGQKIVYVWVLPGILLLMGTVLLIRRQRK